MWSASSSNRPQNLSNSTHSESISSAMHYHFEDFRIFPPSEALADSRMAWLDRCRATFLMHWSSLSHGVPHGKIWDLTDTDLKSDRNQIELANHFKSRHLAPPKLSVVQTPAIHQLPAYNTKCCRQAIHVSNSLFPRCFRKHSNSGCYLWHPIITPCNAQSNITLQLHLTLEGSSSVKSTCETCR